MVSTMVVAEALITVAIVVVADAPCMMTTEESCVASMVCVCVIRSVTVAVGASATLRVVEPPSTATTE